MAWCLDLVTFAVVDFKNTWPKKINDGFDSSVRGLPDERPTEFFEHFCRKTPLAYSIALCFLYKKSYGCFNANSDRAEFVEKKKGNTWWPTEIFFGNDGCGVFPRRCGGWFLVFFSLFFFKFLWLCLGNLRQDCQKPHMTRMPFRQQLKIQLRSITSMEW